MPEAYNETECARRYELIRLFTPSMFAAVWNKADDFQSFDRAVDEAAMELLGVALNEREAGR